MRKEISIAIIIGVIFGAIILYGIKIANDTTKSLNQSPEPTPTTSQEPSNKTVPDDKKSLLQIKSHVTGQVLDNKEITISGKALPNSYVTIIWEDDDTIIKTNDQGDFSQNLVLIPGENTIQIGTPDQNNNLTSETLKLYYTTKPIE